MATPIRRLPLRSLSDHRGKLQRTQSFKEKVRTTVKRSLSFTHPRSRDGMNSRNKNEMNIFGSDIVSSEYILHAIDQVKKNPSVLKLEVEDLITSENHLPLLNEINSLIKERQWMEVRFLDSVPSMEDYNTWRDRTRLIMDSFKNTNQEATQYSTFQATFEFKSGSKASDLLQFLKVVDRDKQVCNLAFTGSLYGSCSHCLSESLKDRIDAKKCLTDSISVCVTCGWSKNQTFKHLMNQCIHVLAECALMTDSAHHKRSHAMKKRHSHRSVTSDSDSPTFSTSTSKGKNHHHRSNGRTAMPDYDWQAGAYNSPALAA